VAPALCAESSGSALPQPSGTCALRASKMDDHRAGSIAASLSNRSATVKSGEVVYACLRQPVLGATGFIGSAIVQELSHAGMTRSDAGAKSLIDACADASSDLEATPSWRGKAGRAQLEKISRPWPPRGRAQRWNESSAESFNPSRGARPAFSGPRWRGRLHVDQTVRPIGLRVPGRSAFGIRDLSNGHRRRTGARRSGGRRRCRRGGRELRRWHGSCRRWGRDRRRRSSSGSGNERAGCRDSESFALVPVLVLVNLLAAGLRARTGLLPTRLRAGARVLTGRLVLARVPSAGLLRWGARRAR